MTLRLFFIVLSIILSWQGLEGFVEENTIEKTQSVEVVHEESIISEAKKQSRKLPGKPATSFHSDGRRLPHFVKEKTISETPLYFQNRSIRI